MGHLLDQLPGCRSHCRQGLQKIQGTTFAGHNGACRSLQSCQYRIGHKRITVVLPPINTNPGIQLSEDFVGPSGPAQDAGLTRQYLRSYLRLCRNKPGSDVATAHVFGQRLRDITAHSAEVWL